MNKNLTNECNTIYRKKILTTKIFTETEFAARKIRIQIGFIYRQANQNPSFLNPRKSRSAKLFRLGNRLYTVDESGFAEFSIYFSGNELTDQSVQEKQKCI